MNSEPNWLWETWGSDHPLRKAFYNCATQVLNYKIEGVGRFPASLREPDLRFLQENFQRLLGATDTKRAQERISRVMKSYGVPSNLDLRNQCLDIMGIKPDQLTEAAWQSRGYLAAQFLWMTAGVWANPSQAMLYTATQTASHRAFRMCQGQGEPETTVELTNNLRSDLGGKFITTLNNEGIRLPPGSFLDFATASMQGWKDRLGSDFALVIGTLVMGRPKYRVAVFQAKWESSRGTANVSQDDGGQLDELLSTGMGYYVFYPKTVYGKAFVGTVRSAEDVFFDVWSASDAPAYDVDTCCARDGGKIAWDFPTFVTVAMTASEHDQFGRLFPDAKSVAELLSQGRKRPLASKILITDLTSQLQVAQLAEDLKNGGFDVDGTFRALSALDDPPEPTVDAPTDTSFSDPWS